MLWITSLNYCHSCVQTHLLHFVSNPNVQKQSASLRMLVLPIFIIDETKELAIVCRYYDDQKQKVISQFYEMIPTVSATAESIYKHLVDTFSKDDIPLANILGFAADTTNSMFGEHNSVVSRLKSANPNIYFMRCICHTAHLCASSLSLRKTSLNFGRAPSRYLQLFRP